MSPSSHFEDRIVARIEMYTSPLCGFCHAAKRLLTEKDVAFAEIDVMAEPRRKAEMIERADGRRTVPQIFIDGRGIGGCDELYALERAGELDRLLAADETER
jgi:glutaredoxin 3